jgi:hypothetical protein
VARVLPPTTHSQGGLAEGKRASCAGFAARRSATGVSQPAVSALRGPASAAVPAGAELLLPTQWVAVQPACHTTRAACSG